MQKSHSQQTGITLIELIVVTAIFSVISVISVSAYSGYIETTKVSQAVSQIRALSLIIDDYALEYGEYPTSLSDIGNEGLKDPWGNPYTFMNLKIDDPRRDNDNDNDNDNDHNDHESDDDDDRINIAAARKDGNLVPINTNFDLYSIGKDGESKPPLRAKDSHDDIIYANDGGYIGLASEF